MQINPPDDIVYVPFCRKRVGGCVAKVEIGIWMKMLSLSNSFSLVALVCLFVITLAQQQQQQFIHPLTDMPGPNEDVETSFVFPDYPMNSYKFPLGETITVLCHVSNDGSVPVNISAIMGR